MKEQQHSVQETHDQHREQKQERQPPMQTNAARLPAQQWARLLHRGEGLTDLPEPLLEQLAEAVGNSSLIALLRQGGGEEPIPCMPDPLLWEGPEPEVNYIRTTPPLLLCFSEWPEHSGVWPQPAKPGRIRDRG